MSNGFCNGESNIVVGGDLNPCFSETAFSAVLVTYSLFFGILYWLQIRSFIAPPVSRAVKRSIDRRALLDVFLVLGCVVMVSWHCLELFVRLGQRSWATFHIVSTSLYGVGWSVTALLFWTKSAPGRWLRTGWHLRLWLTLALAFQVYVLKTVLSAATNTRDELGPGESHSFDVNAALTAVRFALTLLAWFSATCFQSGLYQLSDGHHVFNGTRAKLASGAMSLQQPLLQDVPEPDEEAAPPSDVYSPEEDAGPLNRLTFWWLNPLLRKGYDHQLKFDDLYPLCETDRTTIQNVHFHDIWGAEQAQPSPSLGRAIAKTIGSYFMLAGLLKLVYDSQQFVSPQLLNYITQFLGTDNHEPMSHGLYYAFGIFANETIASLILHQYFHIGFRTGMRVRQALVGAIYRKALRLTLSARETRTTGEIVNLMSTDAQRLQDLFPYLHIVWSGPYVIALATFFLWQQLGVSVLAGLGVMVVLSLPMNTLLSRFTRKAQQALMKIKDRRVKVTNEVVAAMKIIKLYAWERPFGKKITSIRDRELVQLRWYQMVNLMLSVMWTAIPTLVALATFAVYSLTGNTLTAAKAFTALALFNALRFPLSMFPRVVNNIVEANVSLGRIKDFLDSQDLQHVVEETASLPLGTVVMDRGTFFWDDNKYKPALYDVNIRAEKGQLWVVVGQTGSGKSALLSALIGELPAGPYARVMISGSSAFTSQVAWIRNATVRDNIVFGRPFDEQRYKQVVAACALEPDLAILPAGDMTEIGAKGINLSGGQKQRVAIARAVYQDADVYLLDDPLSAVDAHVASHILHNTILGLLRNKTVILVSHNVTFLPHAHRVLVLDRGQVTAEGPYTELLQRGINFTDIVKRTANGDEKEGKETTAAEPSLPVASAPTLPAASPIAAEQKTEQHQLESKQPAEDEEGSDQAPLLSQPSSANGGSSSVVAMVEAPKMKTAAAAAIPSAGDGSISKPDRGRLTDEEARAEGGVTWSVYRSYIMASGGYATAAIIFVFLTLVTTANVFTNTWLSYWADHADDHPTSYNLGIYTGFSLGSILLTVVTSYFITTAGFRAARIMHGRLLERLLRVPMYIFDTTPLGRILNRFSKDMYTIDESLPQTLSSYIYTFFRVVSVAVVISVVTPLFMVALVPLGGVYLLTQRFYIQSSRELTRWDSVLRSPIFSHFSETLEGATSIRAYRLQNKFEVENEQLLDKNIRAYYPSIAINRWLAVRLEFIGTVIMTVTAILVVSSRGKLQAGLGALAISYALSVTQSLNWLVRMASDRETNVVSVERVQAYCELPTEAPDETSVNPPQGWPQGGAIVFEDLTLRYRPELDLVLKGISASIRAREKVGVVGRTGAGKSSLLLALLRLVEPASGRILIDGINTSQLGLLDLRPQLSIIPQDPVLFTGTIRFNLDPFRQCTKKQIWKALSQVGLADVVLVLPKKLLHKVAENGSNFSMGQRQLLCMARALLRKSKILLLDEATSSIDPQTDNMVQQTLRAEFADRTVLTIAHRIETILNSDRIMVLSEGRVVEFDRPSVLAQEETSHFAAILKAAHLHASS